MVGLSTENLEDAQESLKVSLAREFDTVSKDEESTSIESTYLPGNSGTCVDVTVKVLERNDENKDVNKPVKPLSCRILICSTSEQVDGNKLPVFPSKFILVKGRQSLLKSVFKWLVVHFDCTIGSAPLCISPYHLAEIAAKVSEETPTTETTSEDKVSQSKEPQPMELEFTLPEAVASAGLRRMTVAIPQDSLGILFTDSRKHQSARFDESQDAHMKTQILQGSNLVAMSDVAEEPFLLSAVYEFVACQLSIELRGASLTRIATPSVVVSSDGRVKFLREEAVKGMILFFASLSKPESAEDEE